MKLEKCQETLLPDITNIYLIPNHAKDGFSFCYLLVYSSTKVLVTNITNSKSNLHFGKKINHGIKITYP